MSINKICILIMVGVILVLTAGCIEEGTSVAVNQGSTYGGQPSQPAQSYQPPAPCVEHCATQRTSAGSASTERITCTCGGRTCITTHTKAGSAETEQTFCTGRV